MSEIQHPTTTTSGSQLDEIEARIKATRSEISDVSHEVDAYRARTAAAIAGGAFLFLLALGAGYDLARGNYSVAFSIGLTRELFPGLVAILGAISLTLLAIAAVRNLRRDRGREARLVELELEFAGLLDRREELSEEPSDLT